MTRYAPATLFALALWGFTLPAPAAPPDYSQRLDENFDSVLNRHVYQRYREAAPDGFDVRAARLGAGGDGSGVSVCVADYAFNADHAELPPVTVLGDPPNSNLGRAEFQHGTAVISVLAGLDNGFGVTGMAPAVQVLFASIDTGGGLDPAGAVTACAAALSSGDVLLLAQPVAGPNAMGFSSFGEVPAEWDLATYNAIVSAVAAGIIVVEAAGNGSQDLDAPEYATGNGGHHPFLPANDSGALIVAPAVSAFNSADARMPQSTSNTGSTVDLQGWGQDVVAAGFDNYYFEDGENLGYTENFSGSGAAATMVAAAAAIVQSVNAAAGNPTLSSEALKQLLVATGVPAAANAATGPQPDLDEAIRNLLAAQAPAAPIITPGSGSYDMPIQVSIDYGSATQSSANTNLRYTLNGNDPSPDSFIFIPEQGDTIYLNYGVTIKAQAFAYDAGLDRVLASDVATVAYVSTTPKVETPVITPDGGTFSVGTQIVLSTDTPDATLRYRTDGRSISFFYPGTEYTGPLLLEPGTYEVVARAYKDGYYKSDSAFADAITINAIQLPPPTVYPGSGQFSGSVTAYMGSTVLGADIRYTIDGSDPDADSPLFSEPLSLTETTTLKARTYLDPYTPSEVTEASYVVITQLQPPVISPQDGEFVGPQTVSISAEAAAGQIRYTTNGAEPTSYSTLYEAPFELSVGRHTVKAKAFAEGLVPSQSSTVDLIIYEPVDGSVEDPRLTPFSTQYFVEPFDLVMTSDTRDAEIRYTIADGMLPPDPTESSTLYTGPVSIDTNGAYFVKARAYRFGATASQITQSGQLSLGAALGTTDQPVISSSGPNPAENSVLVTISAPQFQTIFYTTDGSEPVSVPPAVPPSRQYNRPFNLFAPATIRAKTYRGFFASGAEASAELEFQCGSPAFLPDGGSFVESVAVELSTPTSSGANIYYTLDGSEPSEESLRYTAPIELPPGDYTLRARCYRNTWTPSEIVDRVFLVSAESEAPAIVSQPQDQTVTAGSSAAFDVIASGFPTPQIQWQFEEVDLAGETEPLLEIGFADAARAGSYRAVVSNSRGSVVSNAAVLTVSLQEDVLFADGFE